MYALLSQIKMLVGQTDTHQTIALRFVLGRRQHETSVFSFLRQLST